MGRLAEMLAGKRAIARLDLPRAGATFGIMPLTAQEIQDAQVAAQERCARRQVATGSAAGQPVYDQELGVQLVARFLVEPDPPHTPAAGAADEVRQMLTAEEVDYLCLAYYQHQAEVSPSLDSLTKKEISELGEASPSGSSSAGSTPSASRRSSGLRRID